MVVLHLVHGTWPHGIVRQFIPSWLLPRTRTRLWSQAESAFADSVASHFNDRPVRIQTFWWSGRNSQMSRERAATELQSHLQRSVAEFPTALHYLVGHSHGGNVALLAISDRRVQLPDSVRGVVCLATPFLTFLPLRGSRLEEVLRLFPVLTPPLAVAVALALAVLSSATWLESFLRGGVISLLLAPPALFAASLRRREIARRYLRLRRRSSPTSSKLLAVLRAPGDEATLALAVPQLVGLLSRLTWRALVRPLLVTAEKLPRSVLSLLLVVLPIVGLAILLAPEALGRFSGLSPTLQLLVGVSLVPVAFLLAAISILAPVAFLCGIAVGPEMLIAGFVQEVFVEAAPTGWKGAAHWIMPRRSRDSNRGLRHSIHELAGVRATTAQVILDDIGVIERRRRRGDSIQATQEQALCPPPPKGP